MDDVFLVTTDEYRAAGDDLRELATYNRINTLSCIHNAGRGWIGACLSATELLTTLYFDVADEEDAIVLGKGHAAVMQYACLAGTGRIPVEDLLRYKQPGGPQAHTDISTDGIAANTGSLGQALSKCCGLAMARPERMVYAILGDGELQEGQCFEALQTMHARGIGNLVAVVDRNGVQSDSDVADIKEIPDLEAVIRGFGLRIEGVEGNDAEAVRAVLYAVRDAREPVVVIADTVKGAGVSFMAASSVERRGYAWHGKAPDASEYAAALRELRAGVQSKAVWDRLDAYLAGASRTATTPATGARSAAVSTGAAFGDELVRIARTRFDVHAFDADLEKPCKLGAFAAEFATRFVEMGISEQDMVSCAGGYALSGKLPVVNTYGSFFKRAYEQVYVNATEGTKILYAGHYSGLCYGPDGKTHSSTGDLAMMRAIPGMTVLYPAYVDEVRAMLEWFVESCDGPAYIRLHRRGAEDLPAPEGGVTFRPGRGVRVTGGGARAAILTSGPHMTRFCAVAAGRHDLDLYAIPWYGALDRAFVRGLRGYETLFVIEEHVGAGGLLDVVAGSFAALGLIPPRLVHKAVDGFTHSTLEPDGLYEHFGLDAEALTRFVAERLAP